MNDKQTPPKEPEKQLLRRLASLLWLPIAMVPGPVGLLTGLPKTQFILLNAACSLLAAFGLWRGLVKNKLIRGAMGFGFASLFFFLNLSFVAVMSVLFWVINYFLTLGGYVSSISAP